MKRMTDEELEAIAQHHTDMGNPAHVFMRALESAAYERAAMVCEQRCADLLQDRDIQKHWPRIKVENEQYAARIRAMAKESA